MLNGFGDAAEIEEIRQELETFGRRSHDGADLGDPARSKR